MATNWGDKVRSWIAWSREKLPVEGDLPAVNRVEFKDAPWMACISDLFDAADGPRDESVPNDSFQLSALFEEALLPDPKDIPTRFTALSVYCALANHLFLDEETYVSLLQQGLTDDYEYPGNLELSEQLARAKQNRARHEQHLEYFVRLRQIEHIGTWKETRWEILNSYLIRDWARAGKLYDRTEELGLLDIKEIRLLRGQFNYLVVLGWTIEAIIRGFFKEPNISYDPQSYHLESLMWEPKVYEQAKIGSPKVRQYAGLFLSGICFSFNDEAPLIISPGFVYPGDPDEDFDVYFRFEESLLDQDNRERLRVAASDLERALQDSPNPNPAYRSILAKCYFLVGRYHDAAACYEEVHAAIRKEAPPRLWSYMCIAISYQRAGELAKAVEFLDRCSREFPKEKAIYLHKVKLYEQLGNLQNAHESLLKAVELDPALGKTFGIGLALALAILPRNPDAIDDAVERFLSSNPDDAKRVEAFILSHWPSFAKLSDAAEKNWRGGVLLLYCIPMKDIILREALENSAVQKLASAVEVELRGRVFRRFKDHVGATPALRKLAEEVGKGDERQRPFGDFLIRERPLALGQMNYVLHNCQKYQEPLFVKFRCWVQREVPCALGLVPSLYKIISKRNPSSHGDEILVDTERFPRLCREVLEQLAQS
jgi:tetratricopeptide (TPR) repeat protein